MKPIIYKGVTIELSNGFYYPSVNGNIERKTIREVKEWIDEVYIPCREESELLLHHIIND